MDYCICLEDNFSLITESLVMIYIIINSIMLYNFLIIKDEYKILLIIYLIKAYSLINNLEKLKYNAMRINYILK